MKLKLSLLFFFICQFTFAQYEQFESKEFTTKSGYNLKYRVLYPQNYDATKKYPLILFLHGAGERGNDNTSQLKHGSWVFTDKMKGNEAIVLFPQCPKEEYWASVQFSRAKYPLDLSFDYSRPISPPLEAAVDLVQSYINNKKVDKKRTYITGLSMGGMGTFEAVYRFPKLFAAAVPVCGGGDVAKYSKAQAKVAFSIYHGDVDGVIEVKHSREMNTKLATLGARVRYKEYPGVNHNSWDNVFKEEDYPTWFFQFKK